MKLPNKTRMMLRKNEKLLFFSGQRTARKLKIFYSILKPCFHWVIKELYKKGLEKEEAESEVFLLIAELYKKYDPQRSSIVPYVQVNIPWHLNKLRRNIEKKTNNKSNYLYPEIKYELSEEYYFTIPGILFEDKWLKCFTKGEKYLIYRILNSDRSIYDNLSDMGRKQMKRRLSDLESLFNYNWR